MAINKLTSKLKPTDRLGVIEFDSDARTVYDLSNLDSETKKEELHNKINGMKADGGTVLVNAIVAGIKMLKNNFDPTHEKRIVFLTDMQDLSDTEFEEHIKNAANDNIFVSIIGIGMNFNSIFTERISKNKGLNYFSAVKEEHLEKLIVTEFEYNFFPLAFNVSLEYKSGAYTISKTFGSGYEQKEQVDKTEWGLQNHKFNDETFKNIIEFLLLYF